MFNTVPYLIYVHCHGYLSREHNTWPHRTVVYVCQTWCKTSTGIYHSSVYVMKLFWLRVLLPCWAPDNRYNFSLYRSSIHIFITNRTHDMQRDRINSSVDCTPAIVWLKWHLARSNKIAHADVSKQRFSLLTNTWPDSMLCYWGVPTVTLLGFKMNLSHNIYLLLFVMIVCS
jgi:hypothetical protein